MNEEYLGKIIAFTEKCDKEYENGIYDIENIVKANNYLKELSTYAKENKYAIVRALEDKLTFIIKQIRAYHTKYKTIKPASALNFVNETNLVKYIINLTQEKQINDKKLLARFVYIELSKYVYYDISYTRINDLERKKIIVDTPINPSNAKIFSYVVCTQWLQLYKYIMNNFDIEVKWMNRPGEDHVWGEIDLNNGEIIIIDATDYINSSIDLSNAKTTSPTKGFIILPNKFSGIKLQDIYSNYEYNDIKKFIQPYYEINKYLDNILGYIEKCEYPVETILRENELFSMENKALSSPKDASRWLNQAKNFLLNLPIPSNIDGYEIFAYYHAFIEKLPMNVRGNISMKTLYANTFDYKQKRLKQKYLHAPNEYLKYLQELVYNRYKQQLMNNEKNMILEKIKTNMISEDEISSLILEQELKIAEINKRLNPYYAINELAIYNPFSKNYNGIFELYEPSSGRKLFYDVEDVMVYKRENKIL